MAKVTLVKQEPAPPPIEKVVLELTLKEAQALFSLHGRVAAVNLIEGEGPSNDVFYALKSAGVGLPDGAPIEAPPLSNDRFKFPRSSATT